METRKTFLALRPFLAASEWLERRATPTWTAQRHLYKIELLEAEQAKAKAEIARREEEAKVLRDRLTRTQEAKSKAEFKLRDLSSDLTKLESPPPLPVDMDNALHEIHKAAQEVGAAAEPEAVETATARAAQETTSVASHKKSPSIADVAAAATAGVAEASREAADRGQRQDSKDALVKEVQDLGGALQSLLEMLGKAMQRIIELQQQIEKLEEQKVTHSAEITKDARLSEAERTKERAAESRRQNGEETVSTLASLTATLAKILKHPEVNKARREAGQKLETVHKDLTLLAADATVIIGRTLAGLEALAAATNQGLEEASRREAASLQAGYRTAEQVTASAKAVDKELAKLADAPVVVISDLEAIQLHHAANLGTGVIPEVARDAAEEEALAREEVERRELEAARAIEEGASEELEAAGIDAGGYGEENEQDMSDLHTEELDAELAREAAEEEARKISRHQEQEAARLSSHAPGANPDDGLHIEVEGDGFKF